MVDPVKTAVSKVVERENLTQDGIAQVFEIIMEGGATPSQIAGLLVGLRMKGETVDEIAGAAQVMRKKAVRIPVAADAGSPVVDTCGTGGAPFKTFNVSTTAAFVVAGAGVRVAKHGNRAVTSRSGSADVLETLGVDLTLSPEQVGAAVDSIGIGFLFAPTLHPAMKHAVGPRKELGIRTMFNVLGPLTNPAGASVQVLGVFRQGLVRSLAEVLGRLGTRRAWVVHGAIGCDELSLAGKSHVAELDRGSVREFEVEPADVGLSPCESTDLKGGSAEENAKILVGILAGEKGPKRDMVLLNAGASIYLAGGTGSFKEGVRAAGASIDSGEALKRLEALRGLSA